MHGHTKSKVLALKLKHGRIKKRHVKLMSPKLVFSDRRCFILKPLKLTYPALRKRLALGFAQNIPNRIRIQFSRPSFREVEKILAKPIPYIRRGFKQKTIVFEPLENLDQSVLIVQEGEFGSILNIFFRNTKSTGVPCFLRCMYVGDRVFKPPTK